MAWLESHTVLMRHRKLVALASELRIRKSYAMGHLHALWHTALEQQEDGDMSRWTPEMIAACADYPGDASAFVKLLRKHGWMDGDYRIHDWWQYAGPYLRARYKKSPEKWQAIRDRCVTVTSPDTNRTKTKTLTNDRTESRFKAKEGDMQGGDRLATPVEILGGIGLGS